MFSRFAIRGTLFPASVFVPRCTHYTVENFNENPSMRGVAKICEHEQASSRLLFASNPSKGQICSNFASTFKLNGTIPYPFYSCVFPQMLIRSVLGCEDLRGLFARWQNFSLRVMIKKDTYLSIIWLGWDDLLCVKLELNNGQPNQISKHQICFFPLTSDSSVSRVEL